MLTDRLHHGNTNWPGFQRPTDIIPMHIAPTVNLSWCDLRLDVGCIIPTCLCTICHGGIDRPFSSPPSARSPLSFPPCRRHLPPFRGPPFRILLHLLPPPPPKCSKSPSSTAPRTAGLCRLGRHTAWNMRTNSTSWRDVGNHVQSGRYWKRDRDF